MLCIKISEITIENDGSLRERNLKSMDPDNLDVSEFAFPFARGAGFEQNGMTKLELLSTIIMASLLRELNFHGLIIEGEVANAIDRVMKSSILIAKKLLVTISKDGGD